MSSTTIGNWERGDTSPRSDYHDPLVEAIPDGLAMDDVLEADDRFDETDDQPRAYDNEKRLFDSKWLQTLRDQPRITEELGEGRGMSVFTGQQGMFVERLDLTGVEGGGQRDHERVTTVYYLPDDERRALRRFIEETERLVREQLADAPNRFSHDWDEGLHGLLEEEFRFYVYGKYPVRYL